MAKKKTQEEPKEEPSKVEEAKIEEVVSAEEDAIIEKPKEGLATELGEVKELEEEIVDEVKKKGSFEKEGWKPRTSLGMKVKSGEVSSIDYILDRRIKILEPEITDTLLPNLETDLLMVGQAKGKFGGGQKRIFKQTQKKTQEGNKPKFATFAVVGNSDGYVGVGYGKSKETVPAREKAIRQAKMNIIKIRRGCGDWGCGCRDSHTVPFKVTGKAGSVVMTLIPAPKGTGLRVEKECQKILRMAGIRDVWSKADGQTRSKLNVLYACFSALQKLMAFKLNEKNSKSLNTVEGTLKVQV
jgi:small subunit ribosomal protein S5